MLTWEMTEPQALIKQRDKRRNMTEWVIVTSGIVIPEGIRQSMNLELNPWRTTSQSARTCSQRCPKSWTWCWGNRSFICTARWSSYFRTSEQKGILAACFEQRFPPNTAWFRREWPISRYFKEFPVPYNDIDEPGMLVWSLHRNSVGNIMPQGTWTRRRTTNIVPILRTTWSHSRWVCCGGWSYTASMWRRSARVERSIHNEPRGQKSRDSQRKTRWSETKVPMLHCKSRAISRERSSGKLWALGDIPPSWHLNQLFWLDVHQPGWDFSCIAKSGAVGSSATRVPKLRSCLVRCCWIVVHTKLSETIMYRKKRMPLMCSATDDDETVHWREVLTGFWAQPLSSFWHIVIPDLFLSSFLEDQVGVHRLLSGSITQDLWES